MTRAWYVKDGFQYEFRPHRFTPLKFEDNTMASHNYQLIDIPLARWDNIHSLQVLYSVLADTNNGTINLHI